MATVDFPARFGDVTETLVRTLPAVIHTPEPAIPWVERPLLQRTLGVTVAAEAVAIAAWVVFHGPLDLQIYLWGGHAVEHGTMLYDTRALGHWFTYPPFAALTFLPLAHLPAGVAEFLWYLALVAALVFSVRACLGIAGWRPTTRRLGAAVALVAILEPVWHTFALGQVNLLLLALVLWDVRRLSLGKWAGIGIGVATAVKLTPALFVIVLLLGKQRRSAMTVVASFAACTVGGFLTNPSASYEYWSHLFDDTSRVGATYISNQSPFGVAARLLGSANAVGGWYLVVPVGIAALGVVVAAAFLRRGNVLDAAAVTGLTMLLVSPISWSHHWVWALPALAALLRTGGRTDAVIAVSSYVVFLAGFPWWTPHNGAPGEFGVHATTVLADSYTVCGLMMLGRLAVLLHSRHQQSFQQILGQSRRISDI